TKGPDEPLRPTGRRDPELLAQEPGAETELPDRLADVALCEMDAHDGAVRALAQRLAGDRREGRVERLTEAVRSREPLAERVEGTEPKLPVALALDQDPVFVPVRQKIVAER